MKFYRSSLPSETYRSSIYACLSFENSNSVRRGRNEEAFLYIAPIT